MITENCKNTVICLDDIILTIRIDMHIKQIKDKEIKIIISSYERLKEYFGFDFINKNEPIIVKEESKTFHIYNDFYDFEGKIKIRNKRSL